MRQLTFFLFSLSIGMESTLVSFSSVTVGLFAAILELYIDSISCFQPHHWSEHSVCCAGKLINCYPNVFGLNYNIVYTCRVILPLGIQ